MKLSTSFGLNAGCLFYLVNTLALKNDSYGVRFDKLFENYLVSYGKTLSALEYESKYESFMKNFELSLLRNAAEISAGGETSHGLTIFSDISQEEFERNYLANVSSHYARNITDRTSISKYTGKASLVNWAGIYTTQINDQGRCSSCWAFSAVQQIESDAIRTLITLGFNQSKPFSTQQLVSCSVKNHGCLGGWMGEAYNYVQTSGGLQLSSSYPYKSGSTGSTGNCDILPNLFTITITGYKFITENDEEAVKNYLLSTGPLSAAVDASNWNTYTSNVLSICGKSLNHAVQIVGINLDKKYYIVSLGYIKYLYIYYIKRYFLNFR